MSNTQSRQSRTWDIATWDIATWDAVARQYRGAVGQGDPAPHLSALGSIGECARDLPRLVSLVGLNGQKIALHWRY